MYYVGQHQAQSRFKRCQKVQRCAKTPSKRISPQDTPNEKTAIELGDLLERNENFKLHILGYRYDLVTNGQVSQVAEKHRICRCTQGW